MTRRASSAPATAEPTTRDGVLVDVDGYAHEAYDIAVPARFLIRPDNYISTVD